MDPVRDAIRDFSIGRSGQDLAEILAAQHGDDDVDRRLSEAFEDRFSIGELAPALRYDPISGRRSLALLRWGWRKAETDPGRGIFSIAEALRSGDEVKALAGRRCLIPAQAVRRPLPAIGAFRSGGSLMTLAGIWTGFRQNDGTVERSFALLGLSNDPGEDDQVAPCVVAFEDHAAWLGEVRSGQSEILAMIQPADWRD